MPLSDADIRRLGWLALPASAVLLVALRKLRARCLESALYAGRQ